MNNYFNQTPNLTSTERLLKGNEVARLLNVSRSFAYLLMQSGELPVVRLRKAIRVRPSDLENYIANNTVNRNSN